MTGREVIEWIQKNHAEDLEVIVDTYETGYLKVSGLWEGEMDGGAIMIATRCEDD